MSFLSRSGVGAGLVGCLVLAPTAHADDRPAPPGRLKLGPVYLSPRLELRNLGRDTNVFNTAANPVEDLSIVVRPATSAVIPFRDRARVSGSGFADFNYFGSNASESSVDYGGDGRLDVTLWRLTPFAAAGGLDAKQRFSIDLDARVPRRESWTSFGLVGRLASRLATTLSLNRQRYDFDQAFVDGVDVEEALDRDSRTASFELRYELTRKTSLAALYDNGEVVFTEQVGEGPRQVKSERYMGGFVFGERAFVTGRALFGLRRFLDARDESGGAFQRPAFAVNVSTGFLGSGRLTAVVDRDVLYGAVALRGSQDSLQNAYVFSGYRLEGVMELPGDLIGRWSVGLETADYVRRPPLPEGGFADRREHQWTLRAAALKPLGRNVRLGFSLSWLSRTSTVPGNSFDSLRWGLQGEYQP